MINPYELFLQQQERAAQRYRDQAADKTIEGDRMLGANDIDGARAKWLDAARLLELAHKLDGKVGWGK